MVTFNTFSSIAQNERNMKQSSPISGPQIAFLYARVSSKEQEREGFSIPSQIKFLQDYAERKGIEITRQFIDVETAKRAGRTQFNEMVKWFRTEARKKTSSSCLTLLVEKTDRLYRNFKDYVTLDELNLEIHLVKENEILSQNSRSHQKLLHGFKVVMAKNYIDNLSEEIRKGMQEKAEQGLYPSFSPLGYVNVLCNGRKLIQPDPETAPMVQKLFQWYSTGTYSLSELQKKARAVDLTSRRNGATVARATIAKILNNPVYHGEFNWKGKIFRGIHEPLITKELFKKVQEVLDFKGRTRTGRRKHEWIFQGLLFCGHCGCAMVGEMKKKKYTYYRCSGYKGKCPERYVREEILVEKFEAAIGTIRLEADLLDVVSKALKESHSEEKQFHQETLLKLGKEKEVLDRRIEALYLDKLDGVISLDFFQQKTQEWRQSLEVVKEKIEQHGSAHFAYMAEGAQLLELSQKALELFRKFEISEKRRVLQILLSNSTWLNAQLIPVFRYPFDLFSLMNTGAAPDLGLSPKENNGMNEWCTGRDSNSRPLPSEGD